MQCGFCCCRAVELRGLRQREPPAVRPQHQDEVGGATLKRAHLLNRRKDDRRRKMYFEEKIERRIGMPTYWRVKNVGGALKIWPQGGRWGHGILLLGGGREEDASQKKSYKNASGIE